MIRHGRNLPPSSGRGSQIQPVSFGDGPQMPMMAVSPYAKRSFVDHTYTDQVSILKFIEANSAGTRAVSCDRSSR
jgi:hypothetical protein